MILPDTSVWIEYLRRGEAGWARELDEFLARGEVMMCGPVLAELVAGVPAERRSNFALRLRALTWSGLDRDGSESHSCAATSSAPDSLRA